MRIVISGTGVHPTGQWAVPGSSVPMSWISLSKCAPDGSRDLSESQTCLGGICDLRVTVRSKGTHHSAQQKTLVGNISRVAHKESVLGCPLNPYLLAPNFCSES